MAEIYDAPEDLYADASSYTTVALSWVNNESVGVSIQRKEAGGAYSVIGGASSGVTTYNDTTCSGSTQYYYRIRHQSGANTSPWATSNAVWTLPQPPSGLAATWSGKTASLSWTNNGIAYTYVKVYYKKSADASWTTDTETLDGTSTSRDVAIATESTAYDFRIRGYYSSSTLNSDYNTITSQTSGVAAPSGLVGIAGAAQVALTWADNSSVEDGYEVYYKLTSGSTYTLFETTVADATTSTVTGLTDTTSYDFKVRAKDGTSYSDYCTEITVVTGTPPSGTPGTPSLSVTGQTTMALTWTDTATGATRFYIYRSTDGSTYTELTYVANAVQAYAATGLTSNTTYYWKLRAWNTSGYSANYSDAANATTDADLDAPTDVIADATNSTTITLSFTNNSADATYLGVYRKVSGGAYSALTSTLAGTATTYADATCTAGTEYTYRLRAIRGASYGDYSIPVNKTITAISTTAVSRHHAYFALGNKLCVSSETPQNTFTSQWTSKTLDFGDQDPQAVNKFKSVDKVQLEFIDLYANTPVTIGLSVDGGVSFSEVTRNIGTGDGTNKKAIYNFVPVTGQYFIVRTKHSDNDTKFAWTAIDLYYQIRSAVFESGAKSDYSAYTIDGAAFET